MPAPIPQHEWVAGGCEWLKQGQCYWCCDQCNWDNHRCPGCGDHLDHNGREWDLLGRMHTGCP